MMKKTEKDLHTDEGAKQYDMWFVHLFRCLNYMNRK